MHTGLDGGPSEYISGQYSVKMMLRRRIKCGEEDNNTTRAYNRDKTFRSSTSTRLIRRQSSQARREAHKETHQPDGIQYMHRGYTTR